MPFIIKASDKLGTVGWVTPPNRSGLRTVGVRQAAELFDERYFAVTVVAEMALAFPKLGLEYAVEEATGPVIRPLGLKQKL